MNIVFKDLERSELAKDAVYDRFEGLIERFPDLKAHHLSITLSMENSPHKAGPDLFTVKVFCRGGRYKGLTLKKSAPNLYAALADVVDHMLERLNRFGDRQRVKIRNQARQLSALPKVSGESYEENGS